MRGDKMPYINAELLKKERLGLRAREDGIEVSREEGVELRLDYSPDLTLQEVRETLKLVSSSSNVGEGGQKLLPRMDNDPEIRFKKMVAEARDVRGPYLVHGSHRHRAQQVVLANGHGHYEV
jgi:hypothetical protein